MTPRKHVQIKLCVTGIAFCCFILGMILGVILPPTTAYCCLVGVISMGSAIIGVCAVNSIEGILRSEYENNNSSR